MLWTRLTDLEVRSGLSPDGAQRLERTGGGAGAGARRRGRGSLRDRVEGAWLRLGGPACAEDPTDVEDALVFLDLLESWSKAAISKTSPRSTSGSPSCSRCPDAQAPETLQVMTIHKSKGLEFDTVIVPGLGYRTGRDDPQLLQWLERPNAAGGSDLLLAAMTEQGRDEDPVYRCATRLHRRAPAPGGRRACSTSR